MIERRERSGFTLEAGQAVGVVREGVGKDFDRDLTAKVGVGGPIHLAHAAGTKERDDFVCAETSARRETHSVME